mgnify:FL=1
MGTRDNVRSNVGHRSKVQRENHILAERQRREEMNDKFCILRSILRKSNKVIYKNPYVSNAFDYMIAD